MIYKQILGDRILSASSANFSSSSWLLTQSSVVPFEYFRKFLFPFNLNLDINFPILNDWLKEEDLSFNKESIEKFMNESKYNILYTRLSGDSHPYYVIYDDDSFSPLRKLWT